jgi:hypothetical protein
MAQQEQEMLLTYRETKAKLAMLEAKERQLTADLKRTSDAIVQCNEQLEKLGRELNLFTNTTF